MHIEDNHDYLGLMMVTMLRLDQPSIVSWVATSWGRIEFIHVASIRLSHDYTLRVAAPEAV